MNRISEQLSCRPKQAILSGLLMLIACISLSGTAFAEQAGNATGIAGMSHKEALKAGEAMYRKGLLPSGEPMQAIVQGDIPVRGNMVTCESCHMRSGHGSEEGRIISLPTSGPKLYNPLTAATVNEEILRSVYKGNTEGVIRRPAYTDESLGVALRTGTDPSGRKLDRAMPRYQLNNRDLAILTYYLKNLSSEISPGASDTLVKFATIITEEVSRTDRESMLKPLEWFVRARNSKADYQRRKLLGRQFGEEMDKAYRQVSLDVWELKGRPETWKEQLEAYYAKNPVFAILGGLSYQDWSVVHNFCESMAIPCIFPITEQPVVSEKDWYTVYFSRGLQQEAEAAAKFLRDIPLTSGQRKVIQVYEKKGRPEAMAGHFRTALIEIGYPAPSEIGYAVMNDSVLTELEKLSDRETAVFIWGGPEAVTTAEALLKLREKPAAIFLSSTLSGDVVFGLPEASKPHVYLTWPYQLPQDVNKTAFKFLNIWTDKAGAESANKVIAAKSYFLIRTLVEVLMHMKANFYRDYFLDVISMFQDQTYQIQIYPRLSFGPGQKYASKGCYIVQLEDGSSRNLIRKSDWVVH